MMSKHSLRLFQEQFVGFINDNVPSDELLDDIRPAGKICDSIKALEVHKIGYIARLTEALGETFEGSWFVMGDELFFSICEEYIRENRSEKYNLSDYGESFPDFLEKSKDLIAIPFIQDMAKFDWIFKELFHTKQHTSAPIVELQRIETEPNMSLEIEDSVRLFRSQFSIYKLWNHRNDTNEENLNINYESPENLLLYKNDNEIFVKELSEIQYDIILSLKSGQPISAILETITDVNQDELVSVFQIIGSTGIVSGLRRDI